MFDNGPVSRKAWRDMGHVLQQCPNCKVLLSYPANVVSFVVICACGWGAFPGEPGHIVWLSPQLAEDLIKARFWLSDSNN